MCAVVVVVFLSFNYPRMDRQILYGVVIIVVVVVVVDVGTVPFI